MSKIVFPLKAEVRRLWLVDFAAGLVRGMLTVGASGASVQLVTPSGVRETSARVGGDLQFDPGPVFAVVEYVRGFYSEPDDVTRSGYYMLLLARLPWNLEPAIRYERFIERGPVEARRERLTFGVNVYLAEKAVKLTANYRSDLSGVDALLLQSQLRF